MIPKIFEKNKPSGMLNAAIAANCFPRGLFISFVPAFGVNQEIDKPKKQIKHIIIVSSICSPFAHGAGNETRTRDLLDGNQMLYQLSYSRACSGRDLNPHDLTVRGF